jgi:hypothetical protein
MKKSWKIELDEIGKKLGYKKKINWNYSWYKLKMLDYYIHYCFDNKIQIEDDIFNILNTTEHIKHLINRN